MYIKISHGIIINSCFSLFMTLVINTFTMLGLYKLGYIPSYNFLTVNGGLLSFIVGLIITLPIGGAVGYLLPNIGNKFFQGFDAKINKNKEVKKGEKIFRGLIINITWTIVISILVNSLFFAYICFILNATSYTFNMGLTRQLISGAIAIPCGIFFGYFTPIGCINIFNGSK